MVNKQSGKYYWVWSLFLALPVLLFFIAHQWEYLFSEAEIATWFIQYDMPYYMANAREYFDAEQSNLFYPSPFSADENNEAIYFQPHILLLGTLTHFTGLSPGLVLFGFGLFASVMGFYFVARLYERMVGLNTMQQKVGLLLFCYGGGVMAMVGLLFNIVEYQDLSLALSESFFRLDPGARGWWFLNLGRSFILPTEAFYHLLFFASIYFVFTEQYTKSSLIVALLSISHPFTGIELLAIMVSWILFEVFYVGNKKIPKSFIAAIFGIFICHVVYYLMFLNMNAEHRSLFEQWSIDLSYKAVNFIPAYCLVGLFAIKTVWGKDRLLSFVSSSSNRFLIMWFAVTFFLANHEFAFKSVQPLHFTRGYVWASLFLIGAKSLVELLNTISTYFMGKKVWKVIAFILIIFFFLMDNLLWFADNSLNNTTKNQLHYTAGMEDVIQELNKEEYRSYFTFAEDDQLAYWITVYTPLRTWMSHFHNTPNRDKKVQVKDDFFNSCRKSEDFPDKNKIIVIRKRNSKSSCQNEQMKLDLVFENESYQMSILNN